MDAIEQAKEAIAAFEKDIELYRKQGVGMPDELAERAKMLVGLAQAEQLKRIADALYVTVGGTSLELADVLHGIFAKMPEQ